MLFYILLILLPSIHSLPTPKTFVWSGELLAQTQTKVMQGDPSLKAAVALANATALSMIKQGPWTVTDKKYIPPSGDKHDYMSLDKYYWPCNMVVVNCTDNGNYPLGAPPPCNQTTGLPWVQHDGCTNPNMSFYDHDNMINMTEAVIALTIGWYYTNIDDYAKRAAYLLDYWFLDSSTKMNPNLNFGHFVPGVTDGSHGAIIDTHHWPELLDCVAILRLSTFWSESQDKNLMNWFSDFTKWLTTNPLAIQEAAAINNHGVWYDVQTGFIAQHVGLTAVSQNISQNALKVRVEKQITTAGELPQENARTKSWSYNEFCLDAFFHLATLASYSKVDLWNPPSRIKLAFDFQLPYVMQQKKWPYQQIVPFFPTDGCVITPIDQCIGSYFNIIRMAANEYSSSEYENDIPNLPGINYQTSYWNLEIPKEEN